MSMKDWSTTAGDNDTAGTITWAEGQLPSTVNDSARQLMADVRAWTDDGSWHNWGDTHTYSSTTATLVSGNVTARYHAGRAVRAVGSSTGTIYGKIASSSYSAPNTTINYTWDSGTLASETLAVSVGFVGVTGKPIPVEGVRGAGDAQLSGTQTFTGVNTFAAQLRTAKGADVASANPLVLGTDGNYFDVTGTTGFASITCTAGTLFTLQFDGALTLTHGASLNLPGGANITTAAGDEVTFYATAANTVRCICYTKADGTAVVSSSGGAWEYLGSYTASADGAVDIGAGLDLDVAITSTYSRYVIEISDVLVSNDDVFLYLRTSSNGGSSFDAGGSDYQDNAAGAGAQMVVNGSNGIGNAAGERLNATITVLNPSSTAGFTMAYWRTVFVIAAGTLRDNAASGARAAVADVDAFRILASAGTVSGVFRLYGLANA